MDPQRCRQVGDHPEDVYGQRHEQVEPAVNAGKHHVIPEQSFIKTVTAIVIHAGPRLLVEHEGHSHKIAAVIGIDQLGVSDGVTVGIDGRFGGIHHAVIAGGLVTVPVQAAIVGTEADRIEYLKS